MFEGMMARPAATSLRTNSAVICSGMRCGKRVKTDGVNTERNWLEPACCLSKSSRLRAAEIFANCDVLHLGRDDALAGVPQLRDRMAGARAERTALRVLRRAQRR